MRKLLKMSWLLIAVFMLTFTSCKDDPVIDEGIQAKKVDITIDVSNLTGNKADVTKVGLNKNYGTKADGSEQNYPTCTEDESSYIEVTIDGILYSVQFTALTGETEVLQLDADAPNVINMLEVFNGAGVPIYSMPEAGSKEVVEGGLQGVPYDLDLRGFTKTKVNVDVVCWHEYSTQVLAWEWYEINYHQIKTLCFFGDICTKFFEDFHEDGSPYFGQTYDGYDFPAIFSVTITNGIESWTSSNISYQGVGSALCVEYRDDLVVDEDFSYIIELEMPDGTTNLIHTDTFEDGIFSEDGNATGFGGSDGIFTFAVGNCDSSGNNDVDLILPSYLPLPKQAEFKLTGALYPSGDRYIDFELRNIAGTYVIENTITPLAGWCGAKSDGISRNVWYNSDVYSSLEPGAMPAKYAAYNWNVLNWLINNMGSYTSQEIQAAIWHLTDGTTGNSLSTAALANATYTPKVGEYALVLFDPIEATADDKDLQLFIVRVDP